MELDPRDNWICLIRNRKHIIGYLTWDSERFNIPINGTVGNDVEEITPDMIVPSCIPLRKIVELFKERDLFFVLNRNDITHVVQFNDLDKLPMRLCLFSLILELEAKMLQLFEIAPSKYIRHLTRRRKNELEETCMMTYEKEQITPYKRLLATNFRDKCTMAYGDPELIRELPFNHIRDARAFFNRIKKIRNRCAHSNSVIEVLSTPDEWHEFIIMLKRTSRSVSRVLSIRKK